MSDGSPAPASVGAPPGRHLDLPAVAAGAFVLVAIALSLFQLYTAGVQPVGLFYQRGFHLAAVEVLAFLVFPWRRRAAAAARGARAWTFDVMLMGLAIATALYLTVNLDAIVNRAGAPSSVDILAGVIAVLVLLEASRRALGLTISLIAIVFIAYAYTGPYLPGLLRHGGYGTARLMSQLYLGQEGIYGIPLGVAATFVFIFILFGALLEVTGAGQFFMDLAYALTGKQSGGPAKAAVVASAALGSVSGSAIANVVTSGAFTIPLMKRVGYEPHEAGGIEAAASTGGQVLPPIMGAGAFLMAEYTGLPYLEIVRAALLPSLLYMGTVFVFVHLVAQARGLEGLPAEELPRMGATMGRGWHYLLALAVLVGALVMDLSVARVGFLACVTITILAAARALWDRARSESSEVGDARPSPGRWLSGGVGRVRDGFVVAGRNTLTVSLACAIAGIIVGVVGLTGLGLKFSSLMLSLSQGNLILALVLVLLASLVLGMGLPVTASYIVLIILAGPALVNDFGLPVLVAHMVVFWFSQDSNVTPPVCLAAYAASGVAGSDPMRTGLHAWKYAKGLYLIPLLMVAHPEIILGGPLWLLLLEGTMAMLALAAIAAALEGQALHALSPTGRAVLLMAGALAFHPSLAVWGVGCGIALAYVLWDLRTARRVLAA